MTVSAPGKLVLLGDYAVLEGGVALVAAVDRRAKGELRPHDPVRSPPSGVVHALLDLAKKRKLTCEGDLELDTSRFRDERGHKLGLGSSAAVAVVGAALLTGRGDETVLDLALEAHREASRGEGSGIDVAASFYGGVIAARRQPSPVEPLASQLGKLKLSVLFTGKSASTVDLVTACRKAPSWTQWITVMRDLAEDGLRAWEKQNATAFLSIVARYGRAMAQLGRDAGVEVVTPEIDAIMRLADESRHAAAKPSGAGGGDVVLVFSTDDDTPKRIAEKTGTTLLDLSIDRRGLSRV